MRGAAISMGFEDVDPPQTEEMEAHAGIERRGAATRLRSGLRRHGLTPRPRELRRLLRAARVRVAEGNSIELYVDGASGLTAMLAAIEGASERIHLESYILRSDETGRRFCAALAERARAGVEVRVLFDSVGSLGLDDSVVRDLRAAGADAIAFNPLTRLYPLWAPRRRDHRKILVVDGTVGFTGGLNIGDEYYYGVERGPGKERTPWRDAHVRIEGPAAFMLDAVFLESWFRADGPDRPWLELPEKIEGQSGGESVGVLADGPTYHRRRLRDLMIGSLGRSERSARFATPYFIPGRKLREALGAAAARGVRVEILIAGYSDHPFTRWAAHGLLPNLLERGVRVYEYDRSMMHAKLAVFDESWAVLGTSNLDRQSLEHSYEVNLVVEGGELPGKLSDLLDADATDSRAITALELKQRSWACRMRDRLAAAILMRL